MTTPMVRLRSILVFGALVAVLVAAAPAPVASAAGLRGRLLARIDRVREHHDLHRLRLNRDLSRQAHRHSSRMAHGGSLFHSADLAARVRPYGATSWGENIAKAGTISRVCRMWMHSAPHRYNMLYRPYDHAGVGVVRDGRWLWVTVIFYGR